MFTDSEVNPAIREARSAVSRATLVALAALLILAPCLAYLNGVTAPFIFDDYYWIVENPQIRDLATDWRRLDAAKRPVIFLSLALNYRWGYLDVRGYHLFNIGVHILAGLLLFGIVRRTIEERDRRLPASGLAFVIALLWLVHPLQTESVTYVIQRCESMMGMLFLLCLYCVMRGAHAVRGWPWYLAAIGACVLGLGCKEVMVTAPAVVLLYDRVFLAASWREVLRKRGWLYAALGGAALVLAVVMLPVIQGSPGGSVGFRYSKVSAWQYLSAQPGVLLHYLRLVAWPRPLCLDYGWRPASSIAEVWPPAAVVLAMLVGSFVALRHRPSLGFLGVSTFLVLAPTSSFIPIDDLAVERRMYLPLAAVLAAGVLAWYGLTELLLRDLLARRLVRSVPCIFAVLLWMGWTVQRNADYADPVQMWSKVVEVAPHNPRGHFSLGATYNLRGDHARAKACLERAIALDPEYARAHGTLGALLIRLGDRERGEMHLQRALEIWPTYTNALVNMGNLLARDQNWRAAVAYYRQAVELQPYHTVSRQNLARALLLSGRVQEAVSQLHEAIRLNPHSGDLRLQLAWILSTSEDDEVRDGGEALRLAQAVGVQEGDSRWEVLKVLAAAYAELGRFEEAYRAASRCLALMPPEIGNAERELSRSRLNAYRSGQPVRDHGSTSASPASEQTDDK